MVREVKKWCNFDSDRNNAQNRSAVSIHLNFKVPQEEFRKKLYVASAFMECHFFFMDFESFDVPMLRYYVMHYIET